MATPWPETPAVWGFESLLARFPSRRRRMATRLSTGRKGFDSPAAGLVAVLDWDRGQIENLLKLVRFQPATKTFLRVAQPGLGRQLWELENGGSNPSTQISCAVV